MKKELVEKVLQRAGVNIIPKWKAEIILDAFCEVMKQETVETGLLHLRGFGRFVVKERHGRTVTNAFGRGEAAEVPPTRVVRFIPSIAFKEMVRQVA